MKNTHFAILSLLFLSSCGGSSGGTSSSSNQDTSAQPSLGSAQSSSSSSLAALGRIDCTKLDPSKVYMLGTLSESNSEYLLAIADPKNPLDFCVGLPNSYIYSAVISTEGKLIYANGSSDSRFYQMIPDALTKVANEETSDPDDFLWQYPLSTTDNDTVIFTPPKQCGLQYLYLRPSDNLLYYSCPNQIINIENMDSYYDLGSTAENKLLSVLPDGSLLAFTFEEKLKIVDSSRNQFVLTMPPSIPNPVCGSARQFFDATSKKNKIWVECYDRDYYSSQNENLHRRYTINIETKDIQDDGAFSPVPTGTRGYLDGKFDDEGSLWQVGDMQPSGQAINVVIKRSLNNKASELVYTEASYTGTGDWQKDSTPFLRLKNSSGLLITGY